MMSLGLAVSLRRTAAVWIVLLCAACASTPEATPERDAQAKRFEPVDQDAVIYLYRAEHRGDGGVTSLTIDGRHVGQSLPGTFFRVITLPGRHRIAAVGGDIGQIEVEARPHDITYLALHVSGGASGTASTRFERVPSERARAEIQRCCSMLETWRFGQDRLLW